MANPDDSTYDISVKTADGSDAGTTSKISLTLESFERNNFTIENLEQFGKMEKDHHYFQPGNLDIFQLKKPSLNFCKITLTSDGKGNSPGWNVDFVEISVTGSSLTKKINFPVYKRLAPNQLSATVDLCAN